MVRVHVRPLFFRLEYRGLDDFGEARRGTVQPNCSLSLMVSSEGEFIDPEHRDAPTNARALPLVNEVSAWQIWCS